MSKIMLGAQAHAENLYLEQEAYYIEKSIVDVLVRLLRAGKLDGLTALLKIAEIKAIRDLQSKMETATKMAIQESMEEAVDGKHH